jgi:hemolysin III
MGLLQSRERRRHHTVGSMISPTRKTGSAPQDSAMERRADQIVHWIGISAGPVAVCLLICILLRQHGTDHLLSGLVYGFGLLAMLGCSAAYNLTRASPRKDLLRRLDHAAIFVMIAGTYTPFMTSLADANRGHELLTVIWCVALAGAAMKLAFPRRLERVSIPLYLLLGWAIVIALQPLMASMTAATVVLLGVGGALYTAGVVFHLWESLPFHKAVWHGLVVVAAACHYFAVLYGVALAPSS